MRVLITGATGFIGQALALRLLRDGHEVTAYVRDAARARQRLGAEVRLRSPKDGPAGEFPALVEGADAVVNLAGEPVVGRWTASKRRALVDSRVDLTRRLVDAIRLAEHKPQVLISGSAVGYYGSRGDEVLTEESRGGSDFLADLCRDWERAAEEARKSGVRVVIPRIGVVLGSGGGALGKLLPVFGLGLGGAIGSGEQFMPFIHLEDLVELFTQALRDPRFDGVLNATAPTPITNGDFTRALGRALGRPTMARVPAAALKLAFGEGAAPMLASQRAVPRRLESLAFRFRYPTVESALDELVGARYDTSIAPAVDPPESDLPRALAPRYVLAQRTVVDAPMETVFPFFAAAENLAVITPPTLSFEIATPTPIDMRPKQVIDYTIRIAGVPQKWRTVIERWEPGVAFVDSQARGPYKLWWHVHAFKAQGNATVMEDRVYYTPPFGVLGRIAHAIFIRAMLRSIFTHRTRAIRLRFGLVERRLEQVPVAESELARKRAGAGA
jgi:uncharacterized protein (TIGR01777 family)